MNDDERKQNIARRAERILSIAVDMAKNMGWQVESQIEEIRLHYEGYAEPGYGTESGLIATGNWNSIQSYDPNTRNSTQISDLPCRICSLFEKMGIECEWNDEWYECSCGKLVRSSGDSYSWTPSFQYYDGEISCIDCILEDPEGYLSNLEDNSESANTMDEIDPSDYGYIQINEDSYQSGWSGQHDDPSEIAEELRKKGISRFLFNVDSVGQFDSHWSVFVHKDEVELLEDQEGESEEEVMEEEELMEDEVVVFHKETDALNVIVNANDAQCKVCGARLNMGETPCWKCGTNDPTEV